MVTQVRAYFDTDTDTNMELAVRVWTESDECSHLVLVNTNTTRPAQFTLRLMGGRFDGHHWDQTARRRELLGGGSGHRANAQRLFEARYTVPIIGHYHDNGAYDSFSFSDWVGPGQTNVYRIGGVSFEGGGNATTQMLARCSEGAGWQG